MPLREGPLPEAFLTLCPELQGTGQNPEFLSQAHPDPVISRRYKDYREPPWSEHKYDISKDFWAVLAARLAFVIVFQVRVSCGVGDWAPRTLSVLRTGREAEASQGRGLVPAELAPGAPRAGSPGTCEDRSLEDPMRKRGQRRGTRAGRGQA